MSKYFKGKSFKIYYSKSIESLLKKCPNIQFLSLFLKNNGIFESILPLITKYCHYLNEFDVTLKDRRTEPELNEEFLRLFGPKLKYISCGANLDLNSFHELFSIEKKSFTLFSILIPRFNSPERVVGLNLKKLKELNIDIFPQNHLFAEVLQKFHKIRHLGLILYTTNENSVINAFKESPVLQNLIELKYRGCGAAERWNHFLDSLQQLYEKLPKLKAIEIGPVWVKDFSLLGQQLSPLKAFPELKRLKLDLILVFKAQNKKSRDNISLKAFEEFQNITHLSLGINVRQLNTKILTNIDTYLPKLQYLYINPKIITDEEGVKQMAESLSRLSSLHTIDLRLKYRDISLLLEAKVIEKRRKIRNISINN